MRNVWIVVASGLLAFANFVKSQETGRTLYSSRFQRRYDNLDIDTILSSNRLVNNYVDCLLSRKPCPPEGKDLKRILPEALRTKCGRCSSTQKENALKIITTLYYSYPDQYQALRERWDPSGEYHRRFEEYLRGIQFNQIGGNGNGNGGPSERPVRNDFDRDQSQILLQTLILSTTTAQPPVPEQRPTQLASAQLTQPVAPITSTTTTSSTTTTTTTTTPTTSTSTTTMSTPPVPTTPNSSVEPSSSTSSSTSTTTASSSGGVSGDEAGGGSEPPTSIPATDSQPTAGPLSNRFGDDDTPVTTSTTQRPPVVVQQTQPTTTQRPVVVRQTTTRPPTQRTTSRFNPQQNGGGAQSPIVGLFNQIGNKLATTADAIAGMLRKTVDVIVTSHIQSHQRALRSFGAQ
ncbi:cell wall protein DAN4 isoform X4 [Culex quinquefasciatus]|uniref:cell wall protein DAN4 isoform X4 n=1 Tax=Culex quinquefasciatus TaxID=7176 RepID=UPI0018E3215D|nr:cell wall protein DAN4 isoform X4 [Culex quinquefasciatus]